MEGAAPPQKSNQVPSHPKAARCQQERTFSAPNIVIKFQQHPREPKASYQKPNQPTTNRPKPKAANIYCNFTNQLSTKSQQKKLSNPSHQNPLQKPQKLQKSKATEPQKPQSQKPTHKLIKQTNMFKHNKEQNT